MKRDFLRALGLSDEHIDKIMTEHGRAVETHKAKIADFEEKLTAYKSQVTERDKQLETLKKSVGDSESLQNQISKLQADNKKSSAEYEAKIYRMSVDSAVKLALTTAGVKDVKYGLAGLNLTDAKMDGDKVIGLDDQITKLKESAPYLFNEAPKTSMTGLKPAEGGGTPPTTAQPGSYEYFAQNYHGS